MIRLISEEDAYNVLTDYYHHRTETQHQSLKEALSRVTTIEPGRDIQHAESISLISVVEDVADAAYAQGWEDRNAEVANDEAR